MPATRIVLVWWVLVGMVPLQTQTQPAWQLAAGGDFAGVPLMLLPVGDPSKEARPDGKVVWAALVEGMAKDARTQVLLRKMLNARTVTIAVVPEKVDDAFRPAAAPGGPSEVFLGVRLTEPKAGVGMLQGCVVGRATRLVFEVPPTRRWTAEATAWHAFVIAGNEYLHRTGKRYHLHSGELRDPSKLDERARDPARRGRYLYEAIKKYLDGYEP